MRKRNILESADEQVLLNPPHSGSRRPAVIRGARRAPEAKAIKQIAKGDVSMTAPSPSAENEWTDEDIARLDAVLGQYYPPK